MPNGTLSARGANGATFTTTLGPSVPAGEFATIAPGPAAFTPAASVYLLPSGVVKDTFSVTVGPMPFDVASFLQYAVTLPGAPTPTPNPVQPVGYTVFQVTIFDTSVSPAAFVWVVGASELPCQYVNPPYPVTIVPSGSPAPCPSPVAAQHVLVPGRLYVFMISA